MSIGIEPANPRSNYATYSTYGMNNAAKRLRGKSFGQRTGRFSSSHARRTNFRTVLAQSRATAFYFVPAGAMRTEHHPGPVVSSHGTAELWPAEYLLHGSLPHHPKSADTIRPMMTETDRAAAGA